MLFHSTSFLLLFLPVLFIGFHLARELPGGGKLALWILLAGSLLFYASWHPPFVWILLFSIFFNYGAGLLIEILRRQGDGLLLTILGVSVNLFLLGVFKYATFAAENFRLLTGIGLPDPGLILPIGISFFTFQQIGYLVDVHRGDNAERSLGRYALFVSFFPQLIAGPIVSWKELLPQLGSPARKQRLIGIAAGASLFSIGLFKKVVLADSLDDFVEPVFRAIDGGAAVSAADAWVGLLSYSFQIYFDFSAYSDMAIGLAACFGLRLPMNFDSPYKATSIIDFWRRWHITLSRFLRQYLYIPLGGNRAGPGRQTANLFVTMLLGGLWHGASWNFVFWGALHGMLLGVNHAWTRWARAPRLGLWPARILTFAAVGAGWVLFRTETFGGAGRLYASLAGLGGPEARTILDAADARAVLAALLLILIAAWYLPNSMRYLGGVRMALGRSVEGPPRPFSWRPTFLHAIFIGLLLGLALAFFQGEAEFIYFQF